MQGLIATSMLVILANRLGSARAQLLSCTEIGCPFADPYSTCTLEGQQLVSIGVSNFTTELSAEQLSWTVGYVPRPITSGVAPDTRIFYLGQPPSLSLHDSTSITACALFFNGIAPSLKFNYSESTANAVTSRGSCDDALTATCVSDWTQQAQGMASQLNDTYFTCERLADQLRSHPPASCKMAKKNWGAVTAQEISGSQMPLPLATDGCNPTINNTYSVTKMLSVNSTREDTFTQITPVLTVIKPADGISSLGVDASLSCLKPIFDGVVSDSGFQGGSTRVQGHFAFQLLFSGVLALRLLL